MYASKGILGPLIRATLLYRRVGIVPAALCGRRKLSNNVADFVPVAQREAKAPPVIGSLCCRYMLRGKLCTVRGGAKRMDVRMYVCPEIHATYDVYVVDYSRLM